MDESPLVREEVSVLALSGPLSNKGVLLWLIRQRKNKGLDLRPIMRSTKRKERLITNNIGSNGRLMVTLTTHNIGSNDNRLVGFILNSTRRSVTNTLGLIVNSTERGSG